MYNVGNIVNNIVITLYGDHFVMFRKIKPLCLTPGINIVL